MTDTRSPAAWLRSLAGLLALAGALVLSGCGGGSGAPNNSFQPFLVLNSAGGAALEAYSGSPTSLSVSGGVAPYRTTSSNPAVLPVPDYAQNSPLLLVPNYVPVDTTVQLTVQDSLGRIVVAAVNVHSSPLLLNSLTLKGDDYPGEVGCPSSAGSSSPTNDGGTSFICAGQTGTVAVRAGTGRQIRFEVIQGHFRFFTNGPGQPETFALTYTVPSDVNGNAVARVKADINAPQEIVIIQATDVATGAFVRGVFVIQQLGTAAPNVVPDDVTITGPDSETCSSGVITTFYVFGGHPPYALGNPFPQFLQFSQATVATSGSGFNVTTLGGCVENASISVTDSTGQTSIATLTNELGTLKGTASTTPIPITVTPTPILTLGCGASTSIVATGGGVVKTEGGTQTIVPAPAFFASVTRPDILSALPASTPPGGTITLNRLNSGTVDATVAATSIVNVSLLISDGQQVTTVNVPVRNTCP